MHKTNNYQWGRSSSLVVTLLSISNNIVYGNVTVDYLALG